MTRQRRRFLVSLILVVVVSVAGGWLLSRAGDSGGGDADDSRDGVVTLTPGASTQDPTIGTNAPVAGKLLPDLTLVDLDGNEVRLDDSGGRPAVINFWFSTCEPCKREFPALVEAHAAHGDRVDFIGINPNDSADVAREFADQYGVNFAILRDPDGQSLVDLGVGTFPMTLFVDAGGVIVDQHAGEITADRLAENLDTYFGVS